MLMVRSIQNNKEHVFQQDPHMLYCLNGGTPPGQSDMKKLHLDTAIQRTGHNETSPSYWRRKKKKKE